MTLSDEQRERYGKVAFATFDPVIEIETGERFLYDRIPWAGWDGWVEWQREVSGATNVPDAAEIRLMAAAVAEAARKDLYQELQEAAGADRVIAHRQMISRTQGDCAYLSDWLTAQEDTDQ